MLEGREPIQCSDEKRTTRKTTSQRSRFKTCAFGPTATLQSPQICDEFQGTRFYRNIILGSFFDYFDIASSCGACNLDQNHGTEVITKGGIDVALRGGGFRFDKVKVKS